jgi:hypothetical protein
VGEELNHKIAENRPAATMNRINQKTVQVLAPVIVLTLLFTSPMALAEKGQRTCSLEVSIMAERIKDENPEDDWSFVILTGSGDEKTYHRIDVVPQEKSSQNPDEEIHISSTDRLVEGEFYTIYSTDYTGKEEVFVGLQAKSNEKEEAQVSGFGSTEFNLNCENMFSEGVKNAVMSTLSENEFKVTATEGGKQESSSETVWNVSTFVAYHGEQKPRFNVADLAEPLSVLLWLGWSWHVLF